MEATKMPFSYLFINLTQECDPKLKYLSNLFNDFVNVYIVDGSSFNIVKAKNNNGRIHFINDSIQHLKQFQPSVGTMQMNQYNGLNPMQQTQHRSNNFNPKMHYGYKVEPMNYSRNAYESI